MWRFRSAAQALVVALALARAFAVPSARMTAFGAGMAAAFASNAADARRAEDRLVEIVRR